MTKKNMKNKKNWLSWALSKLKTSVLLKVLSRKRKANPPVERAALTHMPARGRLPCGTGHSAPGSVTAEKGGRMWKGAPAGGGVRTCS